MTPRSLSVLLVAIVALPAALAAIAPVGAAEGPLVEQVTIPSFDGTRLAATVFTPEGATAVPFILMTHGWAGSRQASLTGRVAEYVDAGYGVLTWDSRGFGKSGGEVMLNHPEYEGRDVSALIDWLVANAPVALVEGDPVIGMSGGSYAGGIQLLAAAHEPRIDAIAPEITWNDLAQSLGPNGVVKSYWVSLLFGAGQATSCSDGHTVSPRPSGCQTSALARYYATAMLTNGITPEIQAALAARSPATYMDRIDVPTLLVQGWPDTLFNVDEAVANYEGIKANGADVKLWIYDGGHAGPNTQGHLIPDVVIDWFDCHLALVPDCTRVGPEIEYYTGSEWKSAASWPLTQTTKTASLNGIPALVASPTPTGSYGEWIIPLQKGGENGILSVGNARFQANAKTSAVEATLFAALGIRDASGKITRVGEQTQPVKLTRDQGEFALTIDLVDVAAEVDPGETLVMTLKTADPQHGSGRSPGFVYLTSVVATWGSTERAPQPVPIACGGDATGLPTTGLAVGLGLEETEVDALAAVSTGVLGSVTVVKDGARLPGAFVTVTFIRSTWVGNALREDRVTGVTNEHGAICFAAPMGWNLPGAYNVRAETTVDTDTARATASYTVG